jgi:tetratricopeptide (TPR) repeat protein
MNINDLTFYDYTIGIENNRNIMKALIYTLLTALVLSMLTACTSEPKQTDTEPTALDESLTKAKLPRKYSDMLRYMAQNPDDIKKNGSYTNLVATHYIQSGVPKKAIEVLKRGIINYRKSSNTGANIFLLLDALKSDPAKKQDYINFAQSLKMGSDLVGLDKYTVDIPKDEPSMEAKITEIQTNLTDSSTGRLDLIKVNEFVDAIEYFVIANPNNSESPKYLKIAAEVVNSIKVYPRAIQFYDWILSSFPNSKEAPQALFMKGFTLDDGMNNKKAAKPVYEEFLSKYPNNDFADDTKFLLENINKSDEEIIKQFDSKKKK